MWPAGAVGLRARLHVGQFEDVGGAQLAASLGAASADHLEHVSDEGLRAMAAADVTAVLLPGAAFSLGQPMPDARRMRALGVSVALAGCRATVAAPPPATYLTRDSLLSEARRAARSGSRDLARELLEQRLSTWPDDDELRAELARVDAWDGRWAASEAGYRRVLARHPDDPEVRAGLVPGGRGAWRDHYRSFDPLHVAAYCATEHQIDAYFLLDALAGSDPTGRYRAAADQRHPCS